jgi:dTDP-4-dehydrorhamnose reductase
MIQPTTDCVFSGNREDGNYTEDDIHDESGHYGMSKSLGEPSNLNCTVIRTSIIGRERFNQTSFLEWVLSNDEIGGWGNHYWNGITCLEYCKFIEKIIQENLFWKGVRHVFSPTAVSKYELACMIKEVFEQESIKIRETICEHTVNKTLHTKYERIFEINELYEQLNELKQFALI